jgi:hypothetical protein
MTSWGETTVDNFMGGPFGREAAELGPGGRQRDSLKAPTRTAQPRRSTKRARQARHFGVGEIHPGPSYCEPRTSAAGWAIPRVLVRK